MSGEPFATSEEAPIRIPKWSASDIKGFVRATRLCNQCLAILHPSRRRKCQDDTGDYFKHHTSEDGLTRSVEDGCTICVRVQDFYHRSVADPHSPVRVLGDGSHLVFLDMGQGGVVFFVEDVPSGGFYPLAGLTFYHLYLYEAYIDPTAKSRDDALRTSSKWIKSCLRDHQTCRNVRQQSAQLHLPRPSRLLQLLHPQRQFVQLVTVQDDQHYSYVTLSHRWGDTRRGDPEPPKLSRLASGPGKCSVASLEAGIPVSTLPKTFQDALEIVGHCGFEYLWIDSLCIVQDKDLDGRNLDWEAEAPKVGGIYARAVFNIAATDNKNSEGGLFSKRQGMRLPFFRDKRSLSAVLESWLAFQSTLRLGLLDVIDGIYWGVMRSELVSRGWVTQELLLASANLLCTADQMEWSCPTSSCSETFPLGRPPDLDRGQEYEDRSQSLAVDALRALKTAVFVAGGSASSDPIAAWVHFLHFYSRTSVTYGRDRVVAIRGIAQTFRSVHPGTLRGADYHSGVWSPGISRQLLWQHARDNIANVWPDPQPFSSAPFYLPSWSPLSYGPNTETLGAGKQWNLDISSSDNILISHARMDTSKLDPLGRAHSQEHCVMTLRGALVELIPDQVLNPSGFPRLWHPADYPEESVFVEFDYEAHLSSLLKAYGIDSVHALVLGFSPRGILGLILRPHEGSSGLNGPARWSRIGVLRDERPTKSLRMDHPWPWRRYYDAFEIRRHGFDWEVENPEVQDATKRRWRRRLVAAPDLEDINLV